MRKIYHFSNFRNTVSEVLIDPFNPFNLLNSPPPPMKKSLLRLFTIVVLALLAVLARNFYPKEKCPQRELPQTPEHNSNMVFKNLLSEDGCAIGYGNYHRTSYNAKQDLSTYVLGISPYTLTQQIFQTPEGIEITYWNTKLAQDNYEFINEDGRTSYTYIPNEWELMIRNTWAESNIISYRLLCDWATNPVITTFHDNGHIIIQQTYYEGFSDCIVYNSKTNTLMNSKEDLLLPLLRNDFYPVYSCDIQEDNLVITEEPYCCDDIPNPWGHEKFTFNLNTKELITRTSIPKPLK